ncbi:MAG: hypothetical protein M1834_005276 [Cirrosporium novae-zelandiae]|nr:MAG: hypothetical protein M1834_005276 [Cirrosporium novae-zelandiae]
MLAIRRPTSSTSTDDTSKSATILPNILPCKINHNGPVPISTRYWNPKLDEKDQRLPSDSIATGDNDDNELMNDDEEDDNEKKLEPTKVLSEATTFNEIMIWGHDAVPEEHDPYIKGVEEWVAFAEAVRVPVLCFHVQQRG